MPDDLSSYIANRYLAADSKPSKKRKRKHNASSGLLITDDDESGFKKSTGADRDGNGGSGGGAGAVVAGTSAEFRRAKKSNWATVGGSTTTATDDDAADAADAADAILSAAAAETEAARAAEDEAPVVEGGDSGAVKMADGTHAGLQSAAAVSAQLARRRREEREAYERERKERKAKGLKEHGDEVVYRDATGRRIDISMQREKARLAALEAEEKQRQAKEALKGEVQIEAARRRREELEDAALMPLARTADDQDMNQEMKAETRWNDPMAQFVSQPKTSDGDGPAKGGKKAKGRPAYTGPAAPNRYGIRPGYRWDGVDRGNGFEAERFKAMNRRERNKGLEYSWQMDE